MANNRSTYQQMNTVSINREGLLQVATNIGLSKKDYRVMLCLFTQLDGFKQSKNFRSKDPKNFKKIDIESIADILGIKKKEVKECIHHLMEADIIEPGDSDTVKNGYRFQF